MGNERIMSVSLETLAPAPEPGQQISLDNGIDRRADIDSKQVRLAALLREVGCEGLLILEPENFAWLTSGASARGVLDANELPALYLNTDQRWLLSGNVDSQRLF